MKNYPACKELKVNTPTLLLLDAKAAYEFAEQAEIAYFKLSRFLSSDLS